MEELGAGRNEVAFEDDSAPSPLPPITLRRTDLRPFAFVVALVALLVGGATYVWGLTGRDEAVGVTGLVVAAVGLCWVVWLLLTPSKGRRHPARLLVHFPLVVAAVVLAQIPFGAPAVRSHPVEPVGIMGDPWVSGEGDSLLIHGRTRSGYASIDRRATVVRRVPAQPDQVIHTSSDGSRVMVSSALTGPGASTEVHDARRPTPLRLPGLSVAAGELFVQLVCDRPDVRSCRLAGLDEQGTQRWTHRLPDGFLWPRAGSSYSWHAGGPLPELWAYGVWAGSNARWTALGTDGRRTDLGESPQSPALEGRSWAVQRPDEMVVLDGRTLPRAVLPVGAERRIELRGGHVVLRDHQHALVQVRDGWLEEAVTLGDTDSLVGVDGQGAFGIDLETGRRWQNRTGERAPSTPGQDVTVLNAGTVVVPMWRRGAPWLPGEWRGLVVDARTGQEQGTIPLSPGDVVLPLPEGRVLVESADGARVVER